MNMITFDWSGGSIGNDMHLDLELDSLDVDAVQNLRRLIGESNFFNLPEDLAVEPSADEFHYQMTVDAEDRSHTVRVSDSTMEKSLLPLIKELTLLRMLQ